MAAEALLFQKIKGWQEFLPDKLVVAIEIAFFAKKSFTVGLLKCPNKSKQIHWWQKAEALLVVPGAPLYKLYIDKVFARDSRHCFIAACTHCHTLSYRHND